MSLHHCSLSYVKIHCIASGLRKCFCRPFPGFMVTWEWVPKPTKTWVYVLIRPLWIHNELFACSGCLHEFQVLPRSPLLAPGWRALIPILASWGQNSSLQYQWAQTWSIILTFSAMHKDTKIVLFFCCFLKRCIPVFLSSDTTAAFPVVLVINGRR